MGGIENFSAQKWGGVGKFLFWGGWPNGGDVRKWGGFKFDGGFLEIKSIFRVKLVENGYKTSKKLKNSFLDLL